MKLNKLIVSILIFIIAIGTASVQSPFLPGKLAIYYGFPSLVNGSLEDLTAATDVFSDYDLVVFGSGLENLAHSDHSNTDTIISNLRTPPNNTAVYGYIPIGVTVVNLSQEKIKNRVDAWAARGIVGALLAETVNLPMTEIQSRVDAWASMGVEGIFLDEAGYDFGVSRQRQNDAIDYVHGKGLGVFINAFNPDDVFSSAIDPGFNPTGEPASLGPNDIYLNESFQIILSEFQDPTFWANKSDKAFAYKNQFGTRMATVTTVSENDPSFDQGKFDYAWWSTLLYGYDAMGWGELFFSASDSNLPFRLRPDPDEIGDAFTSPVNHTNTPMHIRTTSNGTIELDVVAHTGKFLKGGIVFYVDRSTGDVFAKGAFIGSGADMSEVINVSGRVEFGDVVELDPTKPGYYRKASANSHSITGVVTTEPGFILGNNQDRMTMSSGNSVERKSVPTDRPMLALMGRVPVKATTENGSIIPGDLLMAASKPGYAQRCAEGKGCKGAAIGKALEGLEKGEGLILVMVMSR
ncbi:hypothetical protein IIC38_12175 [candidate division KSB1 bacterium]|nr:hypothetical protein [candidate division KSB1 bacterium]